MRTESGELKVAEEYCWAVTQVLGPLCRGLSVSSVNVFGFQLDFLAYTRVVDQVYTQFQLSAGCCASRRV